MRRIALNCPEGIWPDSFSGCVVLGVASVSGPDSLTLWLVLELKGGSVTDSHGVLGSGRELPESIQSLQSSVFAVADRDTWEALLTDRDRFLQRVQQGAIHVGGDYRVFGRYSPSLLRLVESSDLWQHLDAIVAQVADTQAPSV